MSASNACSDFVTGSQLNQRVFAGSARICRRGRKIGAMEPGQTRHQLDAEVAIRAEDGLVPGRATDISECGIAVILPVELPIGTVVELEIKLATVPVITRAIVRNRNVFRHGLEFVQSLRDAGYEAGPDVCKDCGGTGFIVRAICGDEKIAFVHLKCADCGATGHSIQAV
jgi:hypothetical protein